MNQAPSDLASWSDGCEAARANARLATARTLEKSSKDATLILYRVILEDFPDTPQAEAAAERIKVLGGD
jgi:hypothetical protein